jgi:hypothetical protein
MVQKSTSQIQERMFYLQISIFLNNKKIVFLIIIRFLYNHVELNKIQENNMKATF